MPARTARTLAALAVLALPLGALTAPPAYAAPVALSSCTNPDNGDPVVSAATVSTAALDTRSVAQTVDLTVTATDTGGPGAASGVASVTAQLWTTDLSVAPEDPVAMTRALDGRWHATLVVPRAVRPGTYQPHLVVTDAAGNGVAYGGGTDRPLADTDVAVRSVRDTVAPRVVRLHLGRTKVDTRTEAKRVLATVRVVDAVAGVKRVLLVAGSGRRSASLFLHRVRGTDHDGVWRGRITVPRYLGDVTWHVQELTVVDKVVNVRRYTYRLLGRLSSLLEADRVIVVRSTGDSTAPSAAGTTVTPGTVDVRGGDQQVVVRVRASDVASPVTAVAARLLDPEHSDGVVDVDLHRVSGAPRDGWWEGTATVPHCGVAGTWTTQVTVTDSADRSRQYFRGLPVLQVVAGDNATAAVVRTFDANGRLVLDFAEDVTGITPVSAPVRSLGDVGDVVGTWTCTDVTGASVSCATGALRRATFAPHPTIAAVGQLVVVLNPEHSLGVTDLAGNPVGRRYTI